MKKRSFKTLALTVMSSALLLSACGSGNDLAGDLAGSLASLNTDTSLPATVTSSADSELSAAIPKILKGLEDIKNEIRALDIRNISDDDDAPRSTSSSTAATSTRSSSSTKTPTTSTRSSSSTKTPTSTRSSSSTTTAKPAAPSAAEKGAAELKALVAKVQSAPFVQLSAEKDERNLDTGKVSFNKLDLYSKLPNVVRINIKESSAGSAGVSALYTSGEGTKVQVKKLFIKLDLDKTDDRLVSNNKYGPDDIDLFGVMKRIAQPNISAELIGKTTFAGKTINILKLTTSGTHPIDSRISHEYIGYEPDTYAFRLWEIYDSASAKDPYYRMSITQIAFPASLPASTFKL